MGKAENIKSKSVMIMLDRERHAKLTMAGIMFLGEQYDGDAINAFNAFDEINKKIEGGKSELERLSNKAIKVIINFVYACLMHEDRNLTVDAVANMIDLNNMREVFTAITHCMTNSMPDSKGDSDSPN